MSAQKLNTIWQTTPAPDGRYDFIIELHNFSSGYAILVPGYKFRGWQFELLVKSGAGVVCHMYNI